MCTEDLRGAFVNPADGDIRPADPTQAIARGASSRGVAIVRKARVEGYRWTGSEGVLSGRMMVERGGSLAAGAERLEITAEHVVTAPGTHAR